MKHVYYYADFFQEIYVVYTIAKHSFSTTNGAISSDASSLIITDNEGDNNSDIYDIRLHRNEQKIILAMIDCQTIDLSILLCTNRITNMIATFNNVGTQWPWSK